MFGHNTKYHYCNSMIQGFRAHCYCCLKQREKDHAAGGVRRVRVSERSYDGTLRYDLSRSSRVIRYLSLSHLGPRLHVQGPIGTSSVGNLPHHPQTPSWAIPPPALPPRPPAPAPALSFAALPEVLPQSTAGGLHSSAMAWFFLLRYRVLCY